MSVVKPCGKVDMERFAIVKRVVETMRPGVTVTYDRGFWFSWTGCNSHEQHRHKWIPQRGSHFPKGRWYPWGGTMCLLVDQLIRWTRHQTTVPVSTIEYWFGPKIALGDKKVLDTLLVAGWPTSVDCVMCGTNLAGCWDWYDWQNTGVDCSGPGCVGNYGCQGKPPVKNNKGKKP